MVILDIIEKTIVCEKSPNPNNNGSMKRIASLGNVNKGWEDLHIVDITQQPCQHPFSKCIRGMKKSWSEVDLPARQDKQS